MKPSLVAALVQRGAPSGTRGCRTNLWLAAVFALLASGLAAQPVSDAPLLNFRLPLFNEQGNRVWDLSSAAVRVLSIDEKRFELTTVHLRMLAGDAASTLEYELFAPLAVIDVSARTATGKGQLHVIGRGVELFGDDWHCEAATKSIVIEHNVVVSFTGDLGNVLK